MSLRQFVPPAFVASLIASVLLFRIPFSTFPVHPSLFVPLLYVLLIWLPQFILLIKEAGRLSRFYPWHLPFFTLAMGWGFDWIDEFADRWGDKVGKVPPFHPLSD